MYVSWTPLSGVVDLTDPSDHQALLGRAEDVVERLMALGADCAEAYVSAGTGVSVQVEKDVVTYTTGDSEGGVGLRVVKDGRLGFAYASDVTRLDDAGAKALDLSRLAPDSGYVLPAGGEGYNQVAGLEDPSLVSMEPGEAVEMAGQMVDAAKAVHEGVIVGSGGVIVGHGSVAVANSEGVSVSSHGTSMMAYAFVVLRDSTISTGFEFLSSRSRDIDATFIGEEAGRMAQDAQGATPMEEGGEMTVVFRPSPFAELLEHTLLPSVIGDAAQRGESAFTGKDGQKVAIESLTVVDDPTIAGGLGSGMADDEGVPTRRNVLIEDGVLQGFLYDTYTANHYGVETTGNASRGGGWKSQPESSTTNVALYLPSMGELEDLVAEVDRGVLVHDLMGCHTSNRSTLDFSVNSTMPYEIRNGELLGVRSPVMLGGNLGEVLEHLIGAGGRARQCPGGSNVILPWMAAEGVTVTP
jgi:PmbA protein